MIYQGFHKILNTRTSSRWFGKFTNAQLYPPFLRLFIRIYVRIFKINLDEYEFDFNNVSTFNAFFTRKLKPGKRHWEDGICSPVDGQLLSFGRIKKGMLFQVKGMDFKQEELTGDTAFREGSFVNLYLSPADYHRIHAPFDMKIESIEHFPGKLLSVSKKNAETIPDLYVKNERVVLKGNSQYGSFCFVLVGALNVGSIGLTKYPDFATNLTQARHNRIDKRFELLKGEELGWFEMGSTVLILVETDHFIKSKFLQTFKKYLLGNQLA